MSWNVVTFAFGGKIFFEYQNYISNQLEKNKIKSFNYFPEDLKNTQEYKNNPSYFTLDTKYGWCSWKPIFILETMKTLNENDMVMMCDVEDIVDPSVFSYVETILEKNPCLLVLGGGKNKQNTKRDCFVFMDCDEPDYWDSLQLEAGISFWKVCDESKQILEEWKKWCLDERVNGDVSSFSNKPNFEEFSGWCGKDQSILTNLAIRDGLPVDSGKIRNYIECNADYWYERYHRNEIQIYRPIDNYLIEILNECPHAIKNNALHSIILTIHNKDWLISEVLNSIIKNTVGNYELIVVIDGCTDNSETIVNEILKSKKIKYKIIHTPDVFETKANNAGLKEASGKYAIIIQDDMVINEYGWNVRMQKPFIKFDDVFAVTARTAHNWIYNENSKHINITENLDNCYCDILIHCDHADRTNIPRDTFAVRASVNRGPLMIDLDDLKTLNYLDEEYAPLDMDDHDLMFRAKTELNKVCGCYWIDYRSDNEWGGTRINGSPAPWYLKSQHKNVKIFYERYKDLLDSCRIIENRKVS